MNRGKRITFAHLNSVLGELGFLRKVVPGKGVGYKHEPTGALLYIRLHRPNEMVPDYVMAATRLELVERGVIEAKQFEELLLAAAA